jgi:hypothetical protein
MNLFEVNNEIELGNAIWSSQTGDTIILKSGAYGNIPIKDGLNYEFKNNASAADILGLGIGIGGDEEWSAGSLEFGNIKIENPKIQKSNIKLYYIFQKKLPFNSRLEHPISFVHANGVILNIVGNDKEGFVLGGENINAESQLPKAIVNIIVPVLEEFDIKKADEIYLSSILRGNYTEEEKTQELEIHQKEKIKKNEIEKRDFNLSIGINLNEFEYKALWSLNSFIREYAKLTNEKKIKGFSSSEFQDGLLFTIVKNLNDKFSFTTKSVINFSNKNLDIEIIKKLSIAFLSSEEYSVSAYTEYHLFHLNYSIATIGMYQEFESLWENADISIYNPYNPNQKDKRKFIEHYLSDIKLRRDLVEMVNARNNIIHESKLKTFFKPAVTTGIRADLKQIWGSETLNEYEIYAQKKPFHWNKSLNVLKNSI